jgi:hypothetical protein
MLPDLFATNPCYHLLLSRACEHLQTESVFEISEMSVDGRNAVYGSGAGWCIHIAGVLKRLLVTKVLPLSVLFEPYHRLLNRASRISATGVYYEHFLPVLPPCLHSPPNNLSHTFAQTRLPDFDVIRYFLFVLVHTIEKREGRGMVITATSKDYKQTRKRVKELNDLISSELCKLFPTRSKVVCRTCRCTVPAMYMQDLKECSLCADASRYTKVSSGLHFWRKKIGVAVHTCLGQGPGGCPTGSSATSNVLYPFRECGRVAKLRGKPW